MVGDKGGSVKKFSSVLVLGLWSFDIDGSDNGVTFTSSTVLLFA